MFKLSFKQQVLIGVSLSILFLLFAISTGYNSIKSFQKYSSLENHTYEVMNKAEHVSLELVTAENSLGNFLFSHKLSLLKPYQTNIKTIAGKLDELKELVSDNPRQQLKVDSIEKYVLIKLDEMERTMDTYQTLGTNAALKVASDNKVKETNNIITGLTTEFVNVEKKLLEERKKKTNENVEKAINTILGTSIAILSIIIFLFVYIKNTFEQQLKTEKRIRDQNKLLSSLSTENKNKNWLLSGVAEVNEVMRGEQDPDELSDHVIAKICHIMDAPMGIFYLTDASQKQIKHTGSYAFKKPDSTNPYQFGEGLAGQVALEKKARLFESLPANYFTVRSGLGEAVPQSLYILPVLFKQEVIAVIELSLNRKMSEANLQFLDTICESIAIALNSAQERDKLKRLFEQIQQQAEELESQQEELRTTNEELIYKTELLQASEEELRVQQEELRQTNAELEEKNTSISRAKEAISIKAQELSISSKYKSEFLANMSHELRTPLNSILILARILKENKTQNMNADQIKYAGVIQTAGTDLLSLINDILDLTKIESGKVDLVIEPVKPQEIINHMEALFNEMANQKNIIFKTQLADQLSTRFVTDLSRVEQIIKNLLSNAFKFTPASGTIIFDVAEAPANQQYRSAQLKEANKILAFKVKDAGIGIAEDKQQLIFEAFQQADGSTSRKYGGTGLGLSISKELANVLGGEIQLQSEVGTGSTFTLFLPEQYNTALVNDSPTLTMEIPVATQHNDELHWNSTEGKEQVLLIVEDDVVFADVLQNYALEKGFKPMLAHSGDTGLAMAFKELPDAIVLDIMLPVMDGWTILKKLKADPRTKHIPVHMMSAGDERDDKAQHEGAIGFLKKPIAMEQLDQAFNTIKHYQLKYNFKTVLLIEDQELQSKIVKEELMSKGIEVDQAFSGKEAMALLNARSFDCIILDLNLPDISGFDLLDQIKENPAFTHIPVVINTAMELDKDKMAHIMKYTEAMVLKSTKSNNRLIDEVSLFINKLKKENNKSSAITLEKTLHHKTIMIADDDMRNIFALSSALQDFNLKIVVANNGKEALQKLEEHEEINMILMDIMMPEMDGYEAMKAIRLNKQFEKLPIIALTAKAMKQDREKCIEAGANDFISKPVDLDKLFSMMRVWLS
ncbi:response regulator [Pedobacter sp.]|uniref:response regulator n=1 Tax=Pedobacter sp. TaxID=1411316 RepID=UPI003D7F1F6E